MGGKSRNHSLLPVEEEKTEDGMFMPHQFADWRDVPLEVFEKKEIRIAVQKALDTVPSKYQEIVILLDVQPLSVAETAKILGLSTPAVKTQFHTARLQKCGNNWQLLRNRWTERLPFLKGKKHVPKY
jgi:RNA polymerase sigma factor (sigma-70 family)